MGKKLTSTLALLLALFTALTLAPSARTEAATDYSYVRVRISLGNVRTVDMNVNGTYFIEENGAEFTGGRLTITATGGDVRIDHSSDGTIYSGDSCSIKRAVMDRNAGYMSFNSRNYLGHFNIKNRSGYVQVVNDVPLAHYLYGVVGHEMSNNFPLEALKAQAVAAKCYVLTNMSISSGADYYIGDTSSDQVYKGYTPSYSNVIAAVDATINVALFANGSLLRTYYAASNGGETNLPRYAWSSGANNAGYGIAQDPYDIANPQSLYEAARIPIGAVNAFSNTGKLYQYLMDCVNSIYGTAHNYIDAITSAQTFGEKYGGTTRNHTTGQVTLTVSNRDDGGNVVAGPAEYSVQFDLPALFRYGVFTNSSLRTYWGQMGGDGWFYFYHMRYGHGVGMSQRGAQQMANSGINYQNILSFYYPGASFGTITVNTPVNPVNTKRLPEGEFLTATASSNVYLRAKASSSGKKVIKAKKGKPVYVYSIEKGWAYAVYDGEIGFVQEKYLVYETSALEASAVVTSYGKTTTSVNFRKKAGESSSRIKKLKKNTELAIYAQIGSWYYVNVDGKNGYVSAEYVAVTGAVDPNAIVTPTPTDVATNTNVLVDYAAAGYNSSRIYLYKGPDSTYGKVKSSKLSSKTVLYVYGLNGSYYRVKDEDGNIGYVAKKYVKLTDTFTDIPAETLAVSNVIIGTGTVKSSSYIRKYPTSGASRVIKVRSGKEVTLYALNDGYYEAEYDGKRGYIAEKYIKNFVPGSGIATDAGAAAQVVFSTGTAVDEVNFRNQPNTESTAIHSALPAGTQISILGQTGAGLLDWYYVYYNGQTGYVRKDYITITYTSPIPIATVAATTAVGSVNTTAETAIFSGPGTTYAQIATVAAGTHLTTMYFADGWYMVYYGSGFGFVSSGTAS